LCTRCATRAICAPPLPPRRRVLEPPRTGGSRRMVEAPTARCKYPWPTFGSRLTARVAPARPAAVRCRFRWSEKGGVGERAREGRIARYRGPVVRGSGLRTAPGVPRAGRGGRPSHLRPRQRRPPGFLGRAGRAADLE